MSDENKSCCPSANGEPTATFTTVPMWIIVLALALLFLGGVYFDYHSGWFNAKVYTPYRTSEELELYQPKSGAAAFMAQGKASYEKICASCHGSDGMGKPNQAPPLAGSEWVVTKGFNRLARIPLAGLNGTMQVKGQDWNLSMAPMGVALSDGDLAAVLTYIRGSWGNKAGEVTADDIKAIRAELGARPKTMNAEQLKALPE